MPTPIIYNNPCIRVPKYFQNRTLPDFFQGSFFVTGRVENPEFAIQGIAAIKELGILGKQYGIAPEIIELLNEIKQKRILLNDNASGLRIDEAITEITKAE